MLTLGALSVAASAQQRPNILLINIDDLGWTDLGFQGSEYYQTPNIDKLRSQGVFFPNAYAPAANSAPSRSSMMTGLYSPRHGVYTVNPADRGRAEDRKLISATNSLVPDPQYPILAQTLKSGGYSTVHVGKWHVGDDPCEQGFDINIGGSRRGMPSSYFSPYQNPELKDGCDGEFLTDRLTTETIKVMNSFDERGDEPFFIYFATYAVHVPIQPKPELEAKYKKLKGSDIHNNPKYAALIESTDTNLGRLLEALEKSGKRENTIIIFTSDNGGLYNVSRQHPLRAGKGSFYEGGIRVPMIVCWDGVTKENTTNESVVSQMDLYPTLLNIAGIDNNDILLDGEDIRLQFSSDKCVKRREPLFWHFPAYLEAGNSETTDPIFRSRPVSVMRDGDWKLIYNYETQKCELYNLIEDIGEKNNLASIEAKRCNKMFKCLNKWLSDVNAPTIFKLNPAYTGDN